MIDPKQGPLFHPGRGEQNLANLTPKMARGDDARRPATKVLAPALTVVK